MPVPASVYTGYTGLYTAVYTVHTLRWIHTLRIFFERHSSGYWTYTDSVHWYTDGTLGIHSTTVYAQCTLQCMPSVYCGSHPRVKDDTLSFNAKVDMENMKWYNPSQVLTAKHASYPQLTATYTLTDTGIGSGYVLVRSCCQNPNHEMPYQLAEPLMPKAFSQVLAIYSSYMKNNEFDFLFTLFIASITGEVFMILGIQRGHVKLLHSQ